MFNGLDRHEGKGGRQSADGSRIGEEFLRPTMSRGPAVSYNESDAPHAAFPARGEEHGGKGGKFPQGGERPRLEGRVAEREGRDWRWGFRGNEASPEGSCLVRAIQGMAEGGGLENHHQERGQFWPGEVTCSQSREYREKEDPLWETKVQVEKNLCPKVGLVRLNNLS